MTFFHYQIPNRRILPLTGANSRVPRITALFCLLCLCCFHTAPAGAVTPPASDASIHINADRMSQGRPDGLYTAEGNVVVLWQGQQLTADRVEYAAVSHMLNATGSVVLSKGTTSLKGRTLVMDMETGRAEMDSTVLSSPDTGATITAERLIRVNDSEFTATATELTTCELPDPSWKFGAVGLKVNLLGYATGRNVIFYVKDIPVLYLPWIAFPVVPENRSGLLFPKFGYSDNRGLQLDLPVYWVISPSQDLQLDLDIMSRRGIGTGIDYRYIRSRGSEGRLNFYTVYDQHEVRWRGQLAQEHKEVFSKDANMRMTVNATSDRSFLNDFGEKSGDYNRQSSETIVNTLNTWQNYAVTSYLRYTEDLYAVDNRATLQTVPALGVTAVRSRIFATPLYFDLDSTAENFYRDSAPSGLRLHLFPRLSLITPGSGVFQTSLFAGAHIRGYSTDRRGDSGTVRASDGDLLPEAGLRISTSLTRVYETGFSRLKKVRHEIVPEIGYSLTAERDQQRLPFYDYTDRMIRRNMVSLAVTSTLNGRFVSNDSTEYRDLSRIRIGADYAVSGERRDLLTLVDSQHPWSDLILESDTWLSRMIRLTFDSRFDLYGKRLSTVATGIEIDDRQGESIGAAYQMARGEVEYFEGRVSTRRIKPVNLSYTTRYSFDRGDFLESVYTAEYRHKCWSFNLAVHQRPGNQSYTVNFNLAGLGG